MNTYRQKTNKRTGSHQKQFKTSQKSFRNIHTGCILKAGVAIPALGSLSQESQP